MTCRGRDDVAEPRSAIGRACGQLYGAPLRVTVAGTRGSSTSVSLHVSSSLANPPPPPPFLIRLPQTKKAYRLASMNKLLRNF